MSAVLPSSLGRVAVLMGGPGAEREISLETGTAVAAALERRGVDVVAIDWPEDLAGVLREGAFDRVFIALHGRGGEDGQIQGLLETLGLPYTGSGVLASALAMDKLRTKWLWQSQSIPTPDFVVLEHGFDPDELAASLGLPMMLKPAREGSSVGAALIRTAAELPGAFAEASRFDATVILERFIAGPEYTCSILEETALPLIRLETRRGFYDYTAKYVDDDTAYHCPCGLAAEREAELQALCLRAFRVLDCSGWGRVDFMLDESGKPWLLEANTVPGMTSHSLVPMAAAAAGIDFDELVLRIAAAARLQGQIGGAA